MVCYVNNGFPKVSLMPVLSWCCTCAAVQNIKSPNDVRGGGGNGRVDYLTMNFQDLFSRRKILSKAFNSHIVCYIV